MLSLVEISYVVLENKMFKFCQYNFAFSYNIALKYSMDLYLNKFECLYPLKRVKAQGEEFLVNVRYLYHFINTSPWKMAKPLTTALAQRLRALAPQVEGWCSNPSCDNLSHTNSS